MRGFQGVQGVIGVKMEGMETGLAPQAVDLPYIMLLLLIDRYDY